MKMACFLAPAAEAAATEVVKKAAAKNGVEMDETAKETFRKEHPFLSRLDWLTNLLWGGSFLLAFEHVWHGEVVPWFPFLTAAADPADAAEMLNEIATTGVSMAVLITLVWVGMVFGARAIESREDKEEVKA